MPARCKQRTPGVAPGGPTRTDVYEVVDSRYEMWFTVHMAPSTTATFSHTPRSSYVGVGSCALCSAPITHIYAATNNDTGIVETFGSNCHYQVTGVDTRQIKAEAKNRARIDRNTQRVPAADLNLHARLTPIVDGIWGDYLSGVSGTESYLLCTIRHWVRDWTRGTSPLADWLDGILRDPEVDRATAARLAAAAGIDLAIVAGKRMDARFGGTCVTCGTKIRKGDPIIFNDSGAHCATHGA